MDRNEYFILLICSIFLYLFNTAIFAESNQQYHTTPDKWKEPRNYQLPFNPNYENRIIVNHKKQNTEIKERILSPNRAYWFAGKPRYEGNLEFDNKYGIKFAAFSPDNPIYIFNERDYLIEIKPSKKDPDYFLSKVNWINEKLIYIEVWWGRALGSSFIFDVESESMIYKEMIRYGKIPFIQWQVIKNKDK
jgi:hypothetical protein